MTTLYQKATAANTGQHLSPVSGSGAYRTVTCPDYGANRYVEHDVYRVDGATQTLLGTNVGTTNTGTTVNGFETLTGTWTPSSTSLAHGGVCLRVTCTVQSDEPGTGEIVVYSGPLMATNLDAQQWTFSHRVEHQLSIDACHLIAPHADSFISGITLSGTPTSARMWVSSSTDSGDVPYANIATTYSQGNWDNLSGNHVHLGRKVGTITNSSFSSPTADRHYLRRTFVSLPFVQAFTLNTLAGVLGWRELDAGYDGFPRLYCWFAQGDGTTVRGTLCGDWQDSEEMDTATATCGRAVAPTTELGEVSVSAGDRCILEVGWYVGPSGGYLAGYHYFGGTTSDLTADGNGTVYPGYIDVSYEASGTTYYKTVSKAAAAAASVSRSTGKVLSKAASVTASMSRVATLARSLIATASVSPSVSKLTGKTFAVAASVVATGVAAGRFARALYVAASAAASANRTTSKTFAKAASITASMSRVAAYARTLSVAASAVPSVARKTARAFAAAASAIASVVPVKIPGAGTLYYKTVSKAAQVVPSVARKTSLVRKAVASILLRPRGGA